MKRCIRSGEYSNKFIYLLGKLVMCLVLFCATPIVLADIIRIGNINFVVSSDIQKKHPELVKLVLGSESINNEEKQYWFDILPSMTDEQVDRLYNILETERRQLLELNLKYQEEITSLNAKHLREAQLNSRLPLFRIETMSHLGSIQALDVDAVGTFAITAGQDKTGRIWNLSSGKLHQTLRLPLANGYEGMLYAAALHPTKPLAVVGGSTKLGDSKGGTTAYVFDRDSGTLITNLVGLPKEGAVVNSLKFIGGGDYLLMTAGYELSLWQTSDWKKVAELPSKVLAILPIGKESADFLVVSDNEVARYSVTLGAMKKQLSVPRSNLPLGDFRWVISPDKKQLLWAESNQPKVWLFDVGTLRNKGEAFVVDFPGVRGRPGLAWRRDGQIFLSYSHPLSGNSPLLNVQLGAKSSLVTLQREAAWNMVTLPDDTILAATSEPIIAKIEANSTKWRVLFHRAASYQDSESAKESILKASVDGLKVEFGFDFHRKDPHVFDIVTRTIKPGTDPLLLFPLRPDDPNTSIQLRNWKDWSKTSLLVDGVWKSLGNMTNSSAAIAPDGKGFVSASDSTTRRYGLDGNYKWWMENESSIAEVLITRNGRLVVSVAYGGVVQWRNYDTGELLLNLFVHSDKRRWVLWTPSGYYDASPEGEGLIGWHVNRGADKAADFFPAQQFRDRFLRPDIINLVLQTRDESVAIEQANRKAGRTETAISVDKILPPVVEGVSIPQRFSETSLPISIRVRAPLDAPSTRLRVLINGEIMPTTKAGRHFSVDGSEELKLQLPPKDSEVQVFADNAHGTSLPLSFKLQWVGDKKIYASGEQGQNRKPKLWVLAVGVSKYQDHRAPQLNYAHLDAQEFAKTMGGQIGKAYSNVQTLVLTNEKATRSSVLAGLEWLKTNVTPGDVGMVFLSGHGFTMATDRRYFFGASDVDLTRLVDTGVPYKAIQDALIEFNLRGGGTRAIFFVDTCHAGDASGAGVIGNVKSSNGDAMAAELTKQENQVLVFASSKGDEVSWEDPKIGHGAFTKALIEGLGEEWRADPNKVGEVTYKGLDYWISSRVPILTKKKQTPRLMTPPGGVDDFPLASKITNE